MQTPVESESAKNLAHSALKRVSYRAKSSLELAVKIFLTQRHHNGTALLIAELAARLGAGTMLSRLCQTSLRRRLNRRYGCYISPMARLGDRCHMPHPVGIVIGDGVVMGDGCVIYQNVTIGARTRDGPDSGYPRLGSNVVVYAGAVIIGTVNIGDGAVVAANAVVVGNVDPGMIAAGVPAIMRQPRLPANGQTGVPTGDRAG